MVPAAAMAQGKKANPRKALHALFKTDARIVCDRAKGFLNVRILGLRSNGADRVIKPFLNELSATDNVQHGTNLNLVYEPSAAAGFADTCQSVSDKNDKS